MICQRYWEGSHSEMFSPSNMECFRMDYETRVPASTARLAGVFVRQAKHLHAPLPRGDGAKSTMQVKVLRAGTRFIGTRSMGMRGS